jgi:dethiobiotin synthetase
VTLFVTATDTGVGKTVVCAALVAACKARGATVGYLKPVASGCQRRGSELVSADVEFVAGAAGLDLPLELMSPVRFETPLSPLAAARAEGLKVDLRPAYAAWRALKRDCEVVIVEGVGGLLVPLTEDLTVASLIADWGVPALVVARPSLGTINHTLLTLYTLASYGVVCPGFVFSGGGADDSTPDNADLISQFSGVPFRGHLPEAPGLDVDLGRPGDLPRVLDALDIDGLLTDLPAPAKD